MNFVILGKNTIRKKIDNLKILREQTILSSFCEKKCLNDASTENVGR